MLCKNGVVQVSVAYIQKFKRKGLQGWFRFGNWQHMLKPKNEKGRRARERISRKY